MFCGLIAIDWPPTDRASTIPHPCDQSLPFPRPRLPSGTGTSAEANPTTHRPIQQTQPEGPRRTHLHAHLKAMEDCLLQVASSPALQGWRNRRTSTRHSKNLMAPGRTSPAATSGRCPDVSLPISRVRPCARQPPPGTSCKPHDPSHLRNALSNKTPTQ
jgi:hypothetical protein